MANEMEFIGYALLGSLIIGSAIYLLVQHEKLNDPNDREVVCSDQIADICSMNAHGPYLLRTLRQNGNLQKEDQQYQTKQEALKATLSTLKRAKIDFVVVTTNEADKFILRRPMHSHRGTQEGKKVGAIEIYRIP